ncbi:MAG: drug/metabolite exporter YedA [Myxococcales bacterium]
MDSPSSTAVASPRGRFALPVLSLSPGVLLSLAAVYLIWSSTYLALRFMVADLPPLLTSGLRYLLAGLLLYTFLRVRGAAAPTRRQWLLSAITGNLMFFVGNGFVAIAAREVPSGVTAMAVASMPLFLAAMEALLGQRPTRLQGLGLGLGMLGVVWMNAGELSVTPGAGVLLMLAPVGWATGSLLVRRVALPTGPMAAAAQMIAGGTVMGLYGYGAGERIVAMPSTSSLLAVVYLVIFGSIVGFSACMHLLRNTSASLATSYAYVNPVLAVALGALVAGERVQPAVLLAGALVVAGVAVLLTSAARPKP